jgi:ubiquinone/menaquinone biosynthesis C-methylase UbiE
MDVPVTDKGFTGSIPELYERYLVLLIFEPYAVDLAHRLAARPVGRLLEIAAGTGIVTRKLADQLPANTSITATDLNQAMLDMASSIQTVRPVSWQRADALALPFEDGSFDAVACQFGVMFFPDKVRAFSEVRRVLAPGGVFAFNVWDRIEENEFAATITSALGLLFPQDPPRFLARTPHGHYSLAAIRHALHGAGFASAPCIDTVAARSRATSAEIPAIAYCQGTPLRNEIEARKAPTLAEATEASATAIRQRFGAGAVDGKIQAHVFVVSR